MISKRTSMNNKEKYEVEESRDMYFVQFTEEPSLEDEEAVKNELVEKLIFRY